MTLEEILAAVKTLSQIEHYVISGNVFIDARIVDGGTHMGTTKVIRITIADWKDGDAK
jgi:hypothetical protein